MIKTINGVKLDATGFPPYIEQLISKGEYEKIEHAFCSQYLTEDDRVLELGCAVGYLMSCFGPKVANWLAVDANPWCVDQARQNYKLNYPDRRAAVLCGVASADVDNRKKNVPFYIREEFFNSSMTSEENPHSKIVETVSVPMLPFNQLVGDCNTLVCDIEGGEKYLFNENINLNTLDKIIIELHPKTLSVSDLIYFGEIIMQSGFGVVNYLDDVVVYARRVNT